MAGDEVDFDAGPVHQRDDGTWVYRASALGGCLRSLAYARMGMTPSAPPDFMLERYQEGTDMEAELLQTGLPEGWFLADTEEVLGLYGNVVKNDKSGTLQLEVEIDCTPRVKGKQKLERRVVVCHPDGVAVNRETGEAAVVEVKFLGPDFFREYVKKGVGFKDQYAWQWSVEMVGTGLPGLYIVGEKWKDGGDEGVGVKVGKIKSFPAPQTIPFHTRAEIIGRVNEIERMVETGELVDCPTPFMFPCGFWAEHEEGEKEPPIDDAGLIVLVGQFIVESMQRDEHAGQVDELRGKIHAKLRELELTGGRVVTGVGEARLSQVASRPGNVSWAKWAAEVQRLHPEIKTPTEPYRGASTKATVKVEIVKEGGEG